jgi:hypothetical protein
VTYTSYAGDLAGYKLHKNALVLDYDGLQPVKSYFFPSYSNAFERKSTTPDFRSNLYWEPGIDQLSDKNELITFYTGDDADSYEVRINGIDKSGKAISIIKTFEVSPASK